MIEIQFLSLIFIDNERNFQLFIYILFISNLVKKIIILVIILIIIK